MNSESKSVRVHFKGWENKYDRELFGNKIDKELVPLYTCTTNWRDNLQHYDLIDFTKYPEMIHNVTGFLHMLWKLIK